MLENLGVELIKIKLPFRLNHVNCFIAEGETGWTIIDTGLHDAVAFDTWKPILEEKEITQMIITHHHPDHYGFAGTLQQITGAEVRISEVERNAALNASQKEQESSFTDNYRKYGVPTEIVNNLALNEKSFVDMVTPHPRVQQYLNEGDKVLLGHLEYEVLNAPGHSDGLVCFFNKEKSVLFSTDHILPRITPNISYLFYGETNPLDKYLQSLNEFKQLNAEIVIPSHGLPFEDANKRIEQIISHHHERLATIIDFLKVPRNAFEVCLLLFGQNLNVHDMRFAIGEAISHLEYLHQKGECSKDLIEGVYHYRV
jgi:glyoxylase-like metal-dependent hydrolase (beta-lactamase superfamily II)